MAEPGIKGVNCATTLAFARQELGVRWDAFVESLPETSRWHATRRILAIEWVPLSEWYPIEVAIFDQLCAQREERYWAFTKRVVESEFNSVYRAFLKVPGPAFVIDKAARIFGTYYNTGGIHIATRVAQPSRETPNVIEVHMPGRYPLLIVNFAAGFEAVLSLTRARNIQVWITDQRVDDIGIYGRFCLAWEA